MTDRPKVRIDQESLTFAELADIEDATGQTFAALSTSSNGRMMAALVWVTVRRTDPAFTYAQALAYGPGDIEQVPDDPEAPGANGGAKPPALAVSGDSIRLT
jgi:hypothetical protein